MITVHTIDEACSQSCQLRFNLILSQDPCPLQGIHANSYMGVAYMHDDPTLESPTPGLILFVILGEGIVVCVCVVENTVPSFTEFCSDRVNIPLF